MAGFPHYLGEENTSFVFLYKQIIYWVHYSWVYGDNNDKLTGVDGENEAAQEKLIADKKAEIAAMEAELETRQAEYKAEVAALNALLGTAEEE